MDRILSGVEFVNKLQQALGCLDLVSKTLGPSGRSIAIKNKETKLITKDGATVLKNLSGDNQIINYLIDYLRDPSLKTAKEAGDGTTTTAIFLKEFFNQVFKRNLSFNEILFCLPTIKRHIQEVITYIEDNSKSISSIEDIYNVALISSNGDEQIAQLISSSLEKIGIGGTISIAESNTNKTSVEIVEGFRFDAGYISPEFINDAKRKLVSYNEPFIMVIDGILDIEPQEILPVLELVARANKPFIVVAEDFSKLVKTMFIQNSFRGIMKVCLIQAPFYGQERKDLLEDISLITGAKLINLILNNGFKNFDINMLGTCKSIQVSSSQTVMMDGGANVDLLNEHISDLNNKLQEMEINEVSKRLNERIERLSSGIAVIKIGGFSEMEVSERKFRVEDALEAVRSALAKGIVPGGCIIWLGALEKLRKSSLGFDILENVLRAPLKILCDNGGQAYSCISEKIEPEKGIGYDFRSQQYVNMLEKGIIEPVKVLESALLNSFAAFETIIKLEGAIFKELDNVK